MRMRRADVEAVLDAARAGYPLEVCGILVGRGRAVERVAAVANQDARPRARYEIAPEDLVRVQRTAREDGLEIVGYYHSHPNHPARPSARDHETAAQGLSDGVVHVIVAVDASGRATPAAWVYRERSGAFEPEPLDVE